MGTKNWCYGAKTPDVEQAVSDAIFAAHQYRNQLCRLELDRRDRHYDSLRVYAPDFVEYEQLEQACNMRLGEAREAIQAERVKQRTKHPTGVAHLVKQASDCKAELKALRATLKAAKHAAYTDPRIIAAMNANTEQHKQARSEAKKNSGLYWGTEAIVTQACKSFSSKAPPSFKRYEGEGQLAVQLQGGLDCSRADRFNTLCYFGEHVGNKRECFIRIDSNPKGKPVFAKVLVVFHRELPSGEIKWAHLERRKIASHVRWTIRLTIDVDEVETDRPLPGEVAIHTGWRMEAAGLRVATWLGSDGAGGKLSLSKLHCDDYLRLDQIRSSRDTDFNRMIGELRSWLKDRDVPEFLTEIRPHLHVWKANARLAKLYWIWLDSRFDGDDDILESLNVWRKQDKRRWQNERRLAVRIVRRRINTFREFAVMLAKRYGVALVASINAKTLAENSQPEDLVQDNTQAHRHAKWAAVSKLGSIIKEKFALRFVDVDCTNITRQCINCGAVNPKNKRKIQCVDCGITYDCDDNAVANILVRGNAAVQNGALLEAVEQKRLDDIVKAANLLKRQAANRAAREKKKRKTTGNHNTA